MYALSINISQCATMYRPTSDRFQTTVNPIIPNKVEASQQPYLSSTSILPSRFYSNPKKAVNQFKTFYKITKHVLCKFKSTLASSIHLLNQINHSTQCFTYISSRHIP